MRERRRGVDGKFIGGLGDVVLVQTNVALTARERKFLEDYSGDGTKVNGVRRLIMACRPGFYSVSELRKLGVVVGEVGEYEGD